MAVTYKSYPCRSGNILLMPAWADGVLASVQLRFVAEAVGPLGVQEIGMIDGPVIQAADMTPEQLVVYSQFAAQFDNEAVAQLGCERG